LYKRSFNPNGEFTNGEFASSSGILIILYVCIYFVSNLITKNDEDIALLLIGFLSLIFFFPPFIISAIRRLNNLGKRRILVIFLFIPIISTFFFLYLIIKKGKIEETDLPTINTESMINETGIAKNNFMISEKLPFESAKNTTHSKTASPFIKNFTIGIVILVTLFLFCLGGYYLGTIDSNSNVSSKIHSPETPTTSFVVTHSTPTYDFLSYHNKSETPTDSTDSFPTDYWRIPPYDNIAPIVWDKDCNKEWEDLVSKHARNLAIAAPYFWEYYAFSSGTRLIDVKNHYDPILREKGFSTAINDQDWQNITLLSYIKGSANNRTKIILQFWQESAGNSPALLVIYKDVY